MRVRRGSLALVSGTAVALALWWSLQTLGEPGGFGRSAGRASIGDELRPAPVGAVAATLPMAVEPRRVDLAFDSGSELRVRVVDQHDGRPVAGALATVERVDAPADPTASDDAGFLTLHAARLPVTVRVDHDAFVEQVFTVASREGAILGLHASVKATGRVTDAAGRAVEHATIQFQFLRATGPPAGDGARCAADLLGVRREVHSGVEGLFTVDDLHPGSYRLHAWASGFAALSAPWETDGDAAQRGIEIGLVAAARLQVRVECEAGEPVAGLHLVCSAPDGSLSYPIGSPTEGLSVIDFGAAFPAQCVLRAVGTAGLVVAPIELEELAALPQPLVVQAVSEAVVRVEHAGASVDALGACQFAVGSAASFARGSEQIVCVLDPRDGAHVARGLYPGRWRATAVCGDAAPRQGGVTFDAQAGREAVIGFPLEEYGSIEVSVEHGIVRSGTALPDVHLTLCRLPSGSDPDDGRKPGAIASRVSGPLGEPLLLSRLSPGDYVVAAALGDPRAADGVAVQAALGARVEADGHCVSRVTVGEGRRSSVVLFPSWNRRLVGQVDRGCGSDAALVVELSRSSEGDGIVVARAAVDEGGRFALDDLEPGSYWCVLRTGEGAPADAVAVDLATTRERFVSLSARGESQGGLVLDANTQQPVPEAVVRFTTSEWGFAQPGRKRRGAPQVAVAVTDGSGAFVFRCLPRRAYSATVEAPGYAPWRGWIDAATRAEPTVVKLDRRGCLDVALLGAVSLDGGDLLLQVVLLEADAETVFISAPMYSVAASFCDLPVGDYAFRLVDDPSGLLLDEEYLSIGFGERVSVELLGR